MVHSALPRIEQTADLDEDASAEAIVRWSAFNGEFGERWPEIYRAGNAAPAGGPTRP